MTYEKLAKELDYDFKSGVFTWKKDKTTRVKAGDIAGTLKDGYLRIRLNNKAYYAHKLAWLYVYKVLPTQQIDHINHNRADNSIVNLRLVDAKDNSKNRTKNKNNTSGVMGVYWYKDRKRWVARIKIDDKLVNLGSYVNFSDAVNARKNAEVLYNYHENHNT